MVFAARSAPTGTGGRRQDLIRRSLAELEAGRIYEAYVLVDISCQVAAPAPDDLALRGTLAARLGFPGLEMADLGAAYAADPSRPSCQRRLLTALTQRGRTDEADDIVRGILPSVARAKPESCEPSLLPDGLPAATVTVIMPVHGEEEVVRQAIDAVLAGRGAHSERLVLVNDRPDGTALRELLGDYVGRPGVTVITNPATLGFASSVNRALLAFPEGDVVLLNDDTLVPPGWLARLAAAAHRKPGIGTVTPLSNNGELTSVPAPFAAVPLPSAKLVAAIDRLAAQQAAGETVELPNGIGFCLYIAEACRRATGLLDDDDYGAGYLEDVDYCLRAAERGFSHQCACDVFVGHAGGVSFGARRPLLVARNRARLRRAFPQAEGDTARFIRADPLRERRHALQLAILRAGFVVDGPSTLVIGRDAVPKPGQPDLPSVMALAGERSLIRLGFAEAGPILHREGAMAPHRLPLESAGVQAASDLEALLRGQQIREIVYLDAHHPGWARELPSLLNVPHAVIATDDSVVSAAAEDPDWRRFLAMVRDYASAAPLLADLALGRGLRLPRQLSLQLARLPLRTVRTRADGAHSVAVFLDGDAPTFAWLLDLARTLLAHRGPVRLVLFGRSRDDDRLRSAGVVVTPMPSPGLAAEVFALHGCAATLALLPPNLVEHQALPVIACAPRPLLSWNPYLPGALGCAAGEAMVFEPDLPAVAAIRLIGRRLGAADG